MRFWQCVCGEQFPEDGSGEGMGRALGHLANTGGRAAGHEIRGLVDGDTGDLLVEGMNPRGAMAGGYVVGKRRPKPRKAGVGPGAGGGGGPVGGGGGPGTGHRAHAGAGGRKPSLDRQRQKELLGKAKSIRIRGVEFVYPGSTQPPRSAIPTPIMVTMEGWSFPLPAPLFGLFSVAREVLAQPNGEEYAWSPEGFATFLWDCTRKFLEWVLPPLLADASGGRLTESAALRILRRMGAMKPEDVIEAAQQAAREVEEAESRVG